VASIAAALFVGTLDRPFDRPDRILGGRPPATELDAG
jgi:hypothetical protein